MFTNSQCASEIREIERDRWDGNEPHRKSRPPEFRILSAIALSAKVFRVFSISRMPGSAFALGGRETVVTDWLCYIGSLRHEPNAPMCYCSPTFFFKNFQRH